MSLWESNLFSVGNRCCIYSRGNPPFLESMGVRQSPYIILSIQEKAFLKGFLNFQVKGHYGSFLHLAHTLFMNTNVHGRHVLWGEAEDAWVGHAWRRRGSEGTSLLSATSWGDAGLWSLMSGCVGLAKAVPGRFRLYIRKNVPGGWSNTGTGFLERWLWTTLSKVCCNVWLALTRSGSCTQSLQIPSSWTIPSLMWLKEVFHH